MKLSETVKFIIYLAVLAIALFIVRTFIFSPVIVKGDSMDPTLIDGERVIALKFGDIKRYDIVTFPAPDANEKHYIKRVIGLPGETIEYRNDVLYINGEEMDEPYLDQYKSELDDGQPLTIDFTFQTLATGYSGSPLMGQSSNAEDFGGVTKVPEGKLFVLGDNRRISKDSRMIGFIDKADVIGDVKFVFWPISRFGTID